jgi:phospholipid/cholesterol/gamma-HCH transport system substrate-binding protein
MVELDKRRDDIHTLFTNTSAMAQQLTGLVRDNRAQLKPALDQLTQVLAVLQKHEQDLDRTIAAMAPFTRMFANVLGNGRWFDTYIQNLTTPVSVGGH